MADQGSSNISDQIKSATQPGDSKTTTQPLSETVQQGAENAKKSGQSGMETTKDAAAKASEAALGALGSGKPIVLSLVDGDNWLTGSAFVVLMM
ncbi:predicted protein [Histoplasma mississippiense (nom. inval.)]|uniref:predicted protein n=1 Tax=Ajellomyces capsulatus (strain NAm1 / WU24) TaxID=2059318 RepID=UPI000157D3E8|nr:predicted protein [Histoplasma mississippiense (nom. inval.)]EDN04819.1 predicted protein [Histoplasma mississippiense (nom. inval.)]